MNKYREGTKLAAKKRRLLILRLRSKGHTLADLSKLLGISAQRVHQLERQEIIEKAPMKTALYRHYDKENNLLYVGISNDHLTRLRGHKHLSEWFYLIVKIEICHYKTRSEALWAESIAIKKESPKFNKTTVSEKGPMSPMSPMSPIDKLIKTGKSLARREKRKIRNESTTAG